MLLPARLCSGGLLVFLLLMVRRLLLVVTLPQVVPVQPSFTVPLVTMVGISSSFVSQGLTPGKQGGAALTGTEELLIW